MTRIQLRLVAAVCGLVLLCPTWSAAQPPPSRPAERGAEFLTVTFAAVTADGRPSVDLTAADVSIKIDGRSRDLKSLQLVSLGASSAEAPSLPPPFGSNALTSQGRTVTLLVDDESFPAGGEVALRAGIDRLLARLSPIDRIALRTIPHGGTNITATTEHARIRAAAGTLVGRGASTLSGSALACRSRTTLEALRLEMQRSTTREAPTIVVFLTAGLAPPRRDAPVTMAPGMCELPLELYRDVGEMAGRARAQFYLVPPVQIMSTGTVQRENIAGFGSGGSDNPVEGIEQLLAVTGGKLLNLGAAERGAFDRIASESTAYYVAAIEPQRSDRGRTHALEVRVAKSGVEVRASRAVTFLETEARISGASPREMLSTLKEFHDLPLRAAAYPTFEDTDGQIRVLAVAEPIDPAVKLTAVSAALFDRSGKPAGGWVAQESDLARPFVIGAMNAPAGVYRLRVAAIDANGRTGTADYDVDVSLAQTGTMKISSILLGLSREGGFVPRLQFISEPVVIGYIEMSGAAPGARVTATLELADGPNAAARIAVPLTIEAGASGRYVGKAALPVGALPPGDYTVRAVVALDDHPPTRVVRTLRKAIPAK